MDLVNFDVVEMTEEDWALTHATLIDNPSLSPDQVCLCQFLVSSIWCRANVQASDNGRELFERVNTEDRHLPGGDTADEGDETDMWHVTDKYEHVRSGRGVGLSLYNEVWINNGFKTV